MVSEPEDYADFRILAARCPSGSKKNAMSYDSTNGITRYRFTLGEVLSWNIDIDVIVGNGWTRITLREIPRFLVDALDFITAYGLQIDGIFRKEGNSARLNRPEVLEVYRGVRQIPSDFTVLDVCTMVKRFLKDLKPTLLCSDEVRMNIIRKAKKARLSGEFELSHLEMVEIFESAGRHLPPAHLGTLGYVMRLLSRIAKHSETHKMTTDNLAVVLVGSVFGDFMAGGGTESRKKMQQARKCTEAELHAKKEDMGVQVAAVKLLIINANLIGLPHGHYVSSNRLHLNSHMNIRSTSAMPNIRCPSLSENEQTPTTTPRVFNMAKASMQHQNLPTTSNMSSSRGLTRRDSDVTHAKNINKPRDSTGGTGTKRSSSFLPIPSLRGLRDRVSNQFLKRNKSPSPDKTRRQVFQKATLPPPPPPPGHSTPVARRRVASGVDSDVDDGFRNRSVQKQGSTSSGRKSRTHTKKGNINSAMKGGYNFDSDSQKSFQMSPISMEKRPSVSSSSSTVTNRSLRRISQSDQNSFTRGDATPPKKKKSASTGLTRRNTADGLRKDYHNRNVTRRSTFWGVDTIAEEKENRRSAIVVDEQKSEREEDGQEPKEDMSVVEDTIGAGESVLELMNSQARQRRAVAAERRQRRLAAATSGPSESMMVLNGSIATFDKLPPTPNEKKVSIGVKEVPKPESSSSPTKSQQEYPMVFQTPVRPKVEVRMKSPQVLSAKSRMMMGQQLEREMKQRLDVVATPMISRRTASESVAHRAVQKMSPSKQPLSGIPLRKLDSIGLQQHGHVWVGKSQTVVAATPIQQNPQSQDQNQNQDQRIPVVEKVVEAEKVSPILARSPLFRSPSTAPPIKTDGAKFSPFFGFRSKSHLNEDRVFSDQEYAGLATPPRDRRLHSSSSSSSRTPSRNIPQSNLIYSSPNMKKQHQSQSSQYASTEHLTQQQQSPSSLTRSALLHSTANINNNTTSSSPNSLTGNRQVLTALSPLVQPNNNNLVVSSAPSGGDDSHAFKCPFLPPMRSHESKERSIIHQSTPVPIRKSSRGPPQQEQHQDLLNSSAELGFGDFNEIIKNSTEDTKFPLAHLQPVEARPSVTALRSSACGLVQSRINHFQTIERSISQRRTSADLSTSGGRPSGVSTTSLKSIDTTTSSTSERKL